MSKKYLKQVLETSKALGSKSLAVFDLDSTLFDVRPRALKVIQSFCELEEIQQRFPDSLELLKTVQLLASDWGLKPAVERAGLGSHSHEFHQALKNHWRQTFFTNEYLHHDIPYEGSVEFVQKLHAGGSLIVYLTGRDIERMGQGSQEVLQKWSFPLETPSAQLVLKPKKGMDDAQFKSDWFATLQTQDLHKIWFFENEPANIHLVRKCHSHVDVVFFESTHSGRAQPPIDLPTILHFLMDD
jgi:hypothetical protein